MKDKKNLFDMNPPESHTLRVQNAVEGLLAEKRKQERRKMFAWLLAPAFASVAGFFIFRENSKPAPGFLAEQDVLIEFDDANDVEVVADLELLEDLEMLEEWDGSEEA